MGPGFLLPCGSEGLFCWMQPHMPPGAVGHGPRLYRGRKGTLAEVRGGGGGSAKRSWRGPALPGPSPSQAGRDAGIPASCEAPPPRRSLCKPSFLAINGPLGRRDKLRIPGRHRASLDLLRRKGRAAPWLLWWCKSWGGGLRFRFHMQKAPAGGFFIWESIRLRAR